MGREFLGKKVTKEAEIIVREDGGARAKAFSETDDPGFIQMGTAWAPERVERARREAQAKGITVEEVLQEWARFIP